MNHSRSSISALLTLAVAVTLSGCGAGVVNPVTGSTPTTVTSTVSPLGRGEGLGAQDYGGHAPLVGAHIYMVQLGAPTASVTQTYGAVVKSLLTLAGTYTSMPVYSGTPAMPYTYTLTTNVNDQFVPATDLVGQPFKYVTTNQYGEAYFTGDYACDAGYPVMLIGYGGSPSYYGAGPNSVVLQAVSLYLGTVKGVQGVADGTSGGIFTYYLAPNSAQLFYTGESVNSVSPVYMNGYNTQTGVTYAGTGVTGPTTGVLSGGEVTFTTTGVPSGTATLTASQYSIFVPGYSGGGLGKFSAVGSATATPAFNPAATNMAMLGLCPTSGNFSTAGNGAINYIYMNEVSTTAAAYALAGFINVGATNQALNDEFHIGAPVGNLVGLQNAAVTAGLLYDIQGSNTATTGGFDGENHTARTTTPCPATGTCAVGTVPNLQINLIANSLAACVDSANTYYWNGTYVAPTSSNQSTACKTLGQYAQDNGYLDTTAPTHNAFNIAQAAFNMARFPEGLGTATTSGGTNGGTQTLTAGTATTAAAFTSAIFNLPAGSNTPFQPTLSAAPNDLSIAIQWNPNNVAAQTAGNAFTDVEIDANGTAWAEGGSATNAGLGSFNLYSLSPSTTVTGSTLGGMNQSLYTAAGGLSIALTSGLSIDTTGNVWAPGVGGVYKFTPGTPAGAQIGTLISANGGAIAVDSSLNQYIPSGNDGNGVSYIQKQNSGGTAAANYPIYPTVTACASSPGWITLDSAGNYWSATSQNNALAAQSVPASVCRFNSSGQQYSLTLPNNVTNQAGASQGFGFAIARGLATDGNDNIWFAEKNQDALYTVTQGTTTSNAGSTINTQHFAMGGRLSAPRGVAVDGSNTIWVSSTGDTTATTTSSATPKYGTGLAQFSDTDVAITPNYITGASAVSSSTSNTSLASVAIDQAGNIWSAQGSQTPGAAINPTLIYEYVGLATPTTGPISVAKANKTVGGKPGLTVAHVTKYLVMSGGILQIYAADGTFTANERIMLSGFKTSTFLNGTTYVFSPTPGFPGYFQTTTNTGLSQTSNVPETGFAGAVN